MRSIFLCDRIENSFNSIALKNRPISLITRTSNEVIYSPTCVCDMSHSRNHKNNTMRQVYRSYGHDIRIKIYSAIALILETKLMR